MYCAGLAEARRGTEPGLAKTGWIINVKGNAVNPLKRCFCYILFFGTWLWYDYRRFYWSFGWIFDVSFFHILLLLMQYSADHFLWSSLRLWSSFFLHKTSVCSCLVLGQDSRQDNLSCVLLLWKCCIQWSFCHKTYPQHSWLHLSWSKRTSICAFTLNTTPSSCGQLGVGW